VNNSGISSVTHHLHQIIPQIQVAQLKSNRKKTLEELCVEDGVNGAADDAEEYHQVVVSCSLTSYKMYQFMYCLKLFIVEIHIFYEFHISFTTYTK
jgi:hypothetical protein